MSDDAAGADWSESRSPDVSEAVPADIKTGEGRYAGRLTTPDRELIKYTRGDTSADGHGTPRPTG